MTINVGEPMPEFALATDEGGTITTVNLKGKTTVLYFYPRDDTPGCTTEAKAFRDSLHEFTDAGVALIGVSADDIESHRKFKDKYELNFTLASDTATTLAQALGIWVQKTMYGRTYMGMDRSTFLVDRAGIVRRIWRKVKVQEHVDEVLAAARALAVAEGTNWQ